MDIDAPARVTETVRPALRMTWHTDSTGRDRTVLHARWSDEHRDRRPVAGTRTAVAA